MVALRLPSHRMDSILQNSTEALRTVRIHGLMLLISPTSSYKVARYLFVQKTAHCAHMYVPFLSFLIQVRKKPLVYLIILLILALFSIYFCMFVSKQDIKLPRNTVIKWGEQNPLGRDIVKIFPFSFVIN